MPSTCKALCLHCEMKQQLQGKTNKPKPTQFKGVYHQDRIRENENRDGTRESDLGKMFSDHLSDEGLLAKVDSEHKLNKKRKRNNPSEKIIQSHLSKEYTTNK